MDRHQVIAAACMFMVSCTSVHASGPPKKDGELNGTIEISGLPPFKGHHITLWLFAVQGPAAPAPFSGNAPPEARLDVENIAESIHFEREDNSGFIRTNFRLRRPGGWYYVQLNVILYRPHVNKTFVQVERFFFRKRAIEIPSAQGKLVVLPVTWPTTRIEDLEFYGTIKPQK